MHTRRQAGRSSALTLPQATTVTSEAEESITTIADSSRIVHDPGARAETASPPSVTSGPRLAARRSSMDVATMPKLQSLAIDVGSTAARDKPRNEHSSEFVRRESSRRGSRDAILVSREAPSSFEDRTPTPAAKAASYVVSHSMTMSIDELGEEELDLAIEVEELKQTLSRREEQPRTKYDDDLERELRIALLKQHRLRLVKSGKWHNKTPPSGKQTVANARHDDHEPRHDRASKGGVDTAAAPMRVSPHQSNVKQNDAITELLHHELPVSARRYLDDGRRDSHREDCSAAAPPHHERTYFDTPESHAHAASVDQVPQHERKPYQGARRATVPRPELYDDEDLDVSRTHAELRPRFESHEYESLPGPTSIRARSYESSPGANDQRSDHGIDKRLRLIFDAESLHGKEAAPLGVKPEIAKLGIRIPPPGKWNQAGGIDAFLTFAREVSHFFKVYAPMTNRLKIHLLASYLQDNPRDWYEKYVLNSRRPCSVLDAMVALRKQFIVDTMSEEAAEQFDHLAQGDSDVHSFQAALSKLAEQMAEYPSQLELKRRLLKGLRPGITRCIRSQRGITPERDSWEYIVACALDKERADRMAYNSDVTEEDSTHEEDSHQDEPRLDDSELEQHGDVAPKQTMSSAFYSTF